MTDLGPGVSASAVREQLQALRADDPPVHGGRVLAYVYDAGVEEAVRAGLEALAAFGEVNALDPLAFPSVARLENDLVGWGLDLMRAPEGSVGTVTSGGTESCILAVLASRDRGTVILLAETAHPAFHKAAHLLGMRTRVLPVDRQSLRLTGEAVAAALAEEDDVALVVASAPSYAHGVVDEIPAIAAASRAHGVPCHVDACIGGIVLAYSRPDGADSRPDGADSCPDGPPDFDLCVPGVTSIAFDLHKYGFAPKGTSLLLFAEPGLRASTYFTFSRWPGYPVVNTTLQSTKSAGPMAAAWAVARVLGDDGYREAVGRARKATEAIASVVDDIDGLRVLGRPDATLLALAADGQPGSGIDPFRLADAMRARGWALQPQPSCGSLPRTVHLTVQPVSWDSVGALADDLRSAADEARLQPWALVGDDLEAAFADLPDLTGGGPMPERMAGVHALIDALPPEARDPALASILGAVFTPRR